MNQKKTTLPSLKILAGTVLVSSLFSGAVMADIAIITSPGTSVDQLSEKEVKDIFLKKKTSFPNGTETVPGDQTKDSALYNDFSEKVLGKKPNQLSAYWSKRVFSGKAMPPKEIGDDNAVKEWAAKTPNSIGYIDASAVDNSVKVLLQVK